MMNPGPLLTAVLLGVVEGITEFIPVSSTGHLLIAENWLPRQSELFNVVIQSGAVLAVLPLFRNRLAQLARWRDPASRLLWALIAVSFFITCIGGVVLKKLKFQLPEHPQPVAWALIVGGAAFLIIERVLKDRNLRSSTSWTAAVAVGFAQLVAAIFPGSSRSGCTIIASMCAGTSRVTATEFSFLVGIPTMLAASALKLFEAARHPTQEDWSMLAVASITAAVVSFASVKWMLRFVQSHSFAAFGVYRIILGAVVLITL